MSSSVFTFGTTHAALDAEAALLAAGFGVEPVPAPPSASGRCGIALRLARDDAEDALKLLERAHVTVSDVLIVD